MNEQAKPIAYNLTKVRLSSCIMRIRRLVASAEDELKKAEARHAEAKALIAAGGEWTRLDATFADESYVADYVTRRNFHKGRQDYHEALFAEVHGEPFEEAKWRGY